MLSNTEVIDTQILIVMTQ